MTAKVGGVLAVLGLVAGARGGEDRAAAAEGNETDAEGGEDAGEPEPHGDR